MLGGAQDGHKGTSKAKQKKGTHDTTKAPMITPRVLAAFLSALREIPNFFAATPRTGDELHELIEGDGLRLNVHGIISGSLTWQLSFKL